MTKFACWTYWSFEFQLIFIVLFFLDKIKRLKNFWTAQISKSSPPEVFLVKGFLQIYRKLTGENPCSSVISKMLLCNFIEIPLWHVCSPVNLLYILRTPFHKNFSEDCLWISKSAPSSKSYNTEEILEIIWKLDDDSTISSVVETNSDNCQSGSPETPKHYQVQRRV